MKERCEMDLSPGMRISPVSASERRAVAGFGGMQNGTWIFHSHIFGAITRRD
ncbi:hypothetical protein Q644_16140 [Brucella intermedia 229E]|uniref:Uncharacterized protein n=1 Tax=Brucella intermedia 229E TaxID=1337887 RepID=U4VI19_9HYPH|nr:hypothetical protein Q644_16140 [Brucella intermedia 229E]